MVEDARYRTKVYVETYWTRANATDDDDNALGVEVMFDSPDYPLTWEFKEPSVVDVVLTIGKPDSKPLIGHDKKAYGYEEHVPIKIFSVDKTGVTGTKAVWQAETELRRITETYPSGSMRTLDRIGDRDQNLGSTILYCTEYILNYRRDTT